MTDKPSGGNSTQIPLDMAERKKLNPNLADTSTRAPAVDQDVETGRFDVMPANAIQNDNKKRAGQSETTSTTSSGKKEKTATRTSTDNYQQVYTEQRDQENAAFIQQQQELADQKAKNLNDPAQRAKEAAAKAVIEKQQADAYRYRAREIQEQIGWWQQQIGLGQYDEAIIFGTIETLQREMNGIPQQYRS